MRQPPTMDAATATKNGYVSITRPYRIQEEHELKWFRNAIRDGRKAKICIVEFPYGPEIWRHKSELDIDPKTGLKLHQDYLRNSRNGWAISNRGKQVATSQVDGEETYPHDPATGQNMVGV